MRWESVIGLAVLGLASCSAGSTPAGIGLEPPSATASSPATSIPASGIPATSGPATGIPATSGPGTGIPASGIPTTGIPATGIPATGIPRPRHTVVVMFENHSYGEVIGNPQASFINKLAREGALFTASYAVTHPSEPNYLALFSGSTHGVTSDQCPTSLHAPNLAADLMAARLSFAGYAEGLPAPGSEVCEKGDYARKHVPWADFSNVPGSVSLPFSRFPGSDLTKLPTVSFVIPDLCHDMHNCSVATGDAWLRAHLGGYARWAMTHDSLLIVTWDEDDGSQSNRIPTIFVGQQVRPGRYSKPIDHYNVLRTIEQAYGLRHDAQAAAHYPITWIWRSTG